MRRARPDREDNHGAGRRDEAETEREIADVKSALA